MHLLGRSIGIELNPGTPSAQTLLDIPSYHFDDQVLRTLPTPVSIKDGRSPTSSHRDDHNQHRRN
jgi:hypothetical protein